VAGAEISQSASKEVTELQHAKEFLEEVNSAVVRQTAVITGDVNISRQIGHVREFVTFGWQFAGGSSTPKTPISSAQNAIPELHLAPDPSHAGVWLAIHRAIFTSPLE
jgi:hypothetical protein